VKEAQLVHLEVPDKEESLDRRVQMVAWYRFSILFVQNFENFSIFYSKFNLQGPSGEKGDKGHSGPSGIVVSGSIIIERK